MSKPIKYLIFDTETNGFPPKARMTQLAFMEIDSEGVIHNTYESLIIPDGWVIKDTQYYLNRGESEAVAIKKGRFFTDNNMSTLRCAENGMPVFDVLRQFQEALKRVDYKVAHNINFDNQILMKELQLANITHQLFQFKKGLCTMQTTTNLCKLPGRYGNYKWPKLMELHNFLFGCDFEEAHDALDDVKATGKCLIELIKRGVIKL